MLIFIFIKKNIYKIYNYLKYDELPKVYLMLYLKHLDQIFFLYNKPRKT